MELKKEDLEGFIAPGLEDFQTVNLEIPDNILSKLEFIKNSGVIREDISLSGTVCYMLLDVVDRYYERAKQLEDKED